MMHFPETITRLDLWFYNRIRRYRLSPQRERWVKIYARLGDGWFWVAVLLWLVLTNPLDRLIATVVPVLASAFCSLILYWTIKLIVRRPRLFDVLGIEAEVPPLDRYSFPSGHTMNNLAVAIALSYFFPAIAGIAIAVPLSWGILRVYFGVHYLSDIVGGVLLAGVAVWCGTILSRAVGWL